MQILQYQKQAYQNSKNKGFWELGNERNRTEMIMLINTELSEAVDADREKRIFLYHQNREQVLEFLNHDLTGDADFQEAYKQYIKGSVEEEMADTAIRLMDYFEGWGIHIEPALPHVRLFQGILSVDIWHLVNNINKAHERELEKQNPNIIALKWSEVFNELVELCMFYRLELTTHIGWKLRYNTMRPYKHAKSY